MCLHYEQGQKDTQCSEVLSGCAEASYVNGEIMNVTGGMEMG